jgi:hypothetical protein
MMTLIHGTGGRFVTRDRVEDEASTLLPDGGLVEYKRTLTRLDVGPGGGQPIEPKCPAEMKILERLRGTWNTRTTFESAAGKEERLFGTTTGEAVLDGRYIQIEWEDPGISQALTLWTYDTTTKTYRTWIFSSDGTTLQFTGKWDEDAQSLTMKTERKDGSADTLRVHFTDKDALELSSDVTNRQGKAVHTERKWALVR